jgi:hypothetical protein
VIEREALRMLASCQPMGLFLHWPWTLHRGRACLERAMRLSPVSTYVAPQPLNVSELYLQNESDSPAWVNVLGDPNQGWSVRD